MFLLFGKVSFILCLAIYIIICKCRCISDIEINKRINHVKIKSDSDDINYTELNRNSSLEISELMQENATISPTSVSPQISKVVSSRPPENVHFKGPVEEIKMDIIDIAVLIPKSRSVINPHYASDEVLPFVELAVKDIKTTGLAGPLQGWDIEIHYRDTNCSSTLGGLASFDLHFNHKADVFLGPVCDYVLPQVTRYASVWHKNVLTPGGHAAAFDSKDDDFAFLTRLRGSNLEVAKAVVKMASFNKWKHVGFLYEERPKTVGGHSSCHFTLGAIYDEFKGAKKEKLPSRSFIIGLDNPLEVMGYFKNETRVLVMCTGGLSLLRDLLLAADSLQMTNGDFAFINVDLYNSSKCGKPCRSSDFGTEGNCDAQKALRSVLTVSARVPDSEDYLSFSKEIRSSSKDTEYQLASNERVSPFLSAFYEAVVVFVTALNETLKNNGSIYDGDVIRKTMWNNTFDLKTGKVIIDSNGDRSTEISILQIHQDTGWYVVVAAIESDQYIEKGEVVWLGEFPPKDIPKCGFQNEICEETRKRKIYNGVSGGLAVLFFMTAILAVWCWRYSKKVKQRARSKWKISWEEITDIRFPSDCFKRHAFPLESSLPFNEESNDEEEPFKIFKDSWRSTRRANKHLQGSSILSSSRSSIASNTSALSMDGNDRQIFIERGVYKGRHVAIKNLSKIQVNTTLMKELCQLKEIQCIYLAQFIGACLHSYPYALFMEYCSRGSLEDFLENEKIKLTLDTRYSLMHDIIKGMSFLHSTPIQYHGRLTSNNCLVDSRFVVKITDFGLEKLREFSREANCKCPMEDPYEFCVHTKLVQENLNMNYFDKLQFSGKSTDFRKLMWMSPEMLRNSESFKQWSIKSKQKIDVYSFAIIAHQILFRDGPFNYNSREKTPKEIVEQVQKESETPFRPLIRQLSLLDLEDNQSEVEIRDQESRPKNSHDVLDSIIDLICRSWSEDPIFRPDFKELNRKMKKLHKTKIVEDLMDRLNNFAINMEQEVERKTKDLLQEKQNTYDLLSKMVPESIANELLLNGEVIPKAYSSVTVYFSDIVGFTSLAAKSTPFQVVNMLNKLYRLFDKIIDEMDVYKVETIGDAYMVVSGLPNRNGLQHAPVISHMALEILKMTENFSIDHMPNEKLKLRVGIHSGPVVAGVVGSKMPRYCLFGDTVNMASRMESSGEPFRIHISPETQQILADKFSHFKLERRGEINIKGKGPVCTYWLQGSELNLRDIFPSGVARKSFTGSSCSVSTSVKIPRLSASPQFRRSRLSFPKVDSPQTMKQVRFSKQMDNVS